MKSRTPDVEKSKRSGLINILGTMSVHNAQTMAERSFAD